MYLFVLCLIFWEVINISDLLSKYRGRNNCVTNQKSYIFYCLFLVYVLYLNFENEKYSLHRKELVHVLYFNGYVNSISFTFFFYKNDKYTWLLPPLMLTHSRLSSLTCPHIIPHLFLVELDSNCVITKRLGFGMLGNCFTALLKTILLLTLNVCVCQV